MTPPLPTGIGPVRFALLTWLLVLALFAPRQVRADAMLQYFNTDWKELTARIPELAEAGYQSLWLPPPTKASGGLSVGYDLWDRFDFGSKDQRGSVRTRYGTEAELQRLIETAHRFGIRVYFDNVMNHNAFDVPGYNQFTPIDLYPGFLPEDFHLRVTEDGFYRKWDNTRDWNSAWQVQNLGLADLIDIAHETPNANFGPSEGSTHPKITFVRHPNNPEYYLDLDLPISVTNPNTGISFTVYTFANKEPYQDIGYTPQGGGNAVGAGDGRFSFQDLNGNAQHDAGEPSEPFEDTGIEGSNPARRTAAWGFGNARYDMGNPVPEDVGGILIRSVRYKMDRLRADGLRLDAVKHVPDYFFGQMSGSGKDASSAGYLGQAQEQFNITRGFSDWGNHRDTVFNSEASRDDALMFGEHLGQPPGYGGYWDAGMRLVDNDLRSTLNGVLGNPSAGLAGLDTAGWGGFAPDLGVMHAQSHDSDFAARRELQHALYFTRAGIPLVYTDGNNQAGTLGQSGGAFPRHANTAFLGQWGDPRLPNVVQLHGHFARGFQRARWSDTDYVAYERIDKRENPSMSDADGTVLFFMLNDNYANGQARNVATTFPSAGGTSNDAYLFNYSTYGGGFYTYASNLRNQVVPPGGYFAFSYRSPEPSELNSVTAGNNQPAVPTLWIHQNGQPVGTLTYTRTDGKDGDAEFNPYSLPNRGFPQGSTPEPRSYRATVPRVTDGSNLAFIARLDGSAENVLLSLNNGVDINSQMGLGPQTGDKRDNPPALSTDIFLGYEQARFVHRSVEKFAARDTARNVIGSLGAETWQAVIGTAGFTVNNGAGTPNTSSNTAAYVYHDATLTRDVDAQLQFFPRPENAAGQPVQVRVKSGFATQVTNGWVYFTIDGVSFPEGSAGRGRGTTQVVPLQFERSGMQDGLFQTDWWVATLPAMPAGTVLRYKVGLTRLVTPSTFPSSAANVALKKRTETFFEITGFNATTAAWRPHNDYGPERVGLQEGFHNLRARAFLSRPGQASIYNTVTLPFYYDAQRPQGEVLFPSENDSVGGSSYGVVVRTDPSVEEVWYRIVDSDPANDDATTGQNAGNGIGYEPFEDANRNNLRDPGESYTDLNSNGQWDATGAEAWARAIEVTPTPAIRSTFEREWRFSYTSIPYGNQPAQILVRLRELSSRTRDAFPISPANQASVDDTTGWFTTITRNVRTNGPDFSMIVAWPSADNQRIPHPYTAKVWFSKTLADGTTPEQLLSRFTATAGGTETSALRATLDPTTFSINYNVNDRYHELAIPLPNLFNGLPDSSFRLDVTHTRPGLVLTAQRTYLQEASSFPSVVIARPVAVGSDGRPLEIVLPELANPTPAQRSTQVQVVTGLTVVNAPVLTFDQGSGTISPDATNPMEEIGTSRFWNFTWSNLQPGTYRLRATASNSVGTAFDTRTATIVFRQLVERDANRTDDDDDGLLDAWESTITSLPETNSETWNNGDVHVSRAFGNSNPLSPDTDGDGLPDALEVGWREATAATNTAIDTDGDGRPNFLPDLDPPFFNTLDNLGKVPEVNSAAEGGDRSRLVRGSMTNPNNADTDGDGLPDGIEDANRNGWLDGDGALLAPGAAPTLTRNWPNGRRDPGEVWTETNPNAADTDGDGLSDGFGEDRDFDGRIAGDVNLNRTYDSSEAWTETNPLATDTDSDGLPDGWEVTFGLDPLDNGSDSLRTTAPQDGTLANGASGDPDADGFNNLQEFQNGTHPKFADNPNDTPPAGSIFIGPQDPITFGAVSNRREFTDWTLDDLIALDAYEGDGPNNQSGDIFPAYDGFDSSRDIVAFYARDGGAAQQGGDGQFYFRLDFHDLRAFAEEGNLDLYVVVDTGNTAVGESALPDSIDTRTEMRWEAVVAVYQSNLGAVLVDTQPANNTTAINQDLSQTGVERRDQNHPAGFRKAYFNSDLDAVEFSISRQALVDAGWNGNVNTLNFQVFTTKDGTANTPPGAGDLGGRSDIRDSVRNNWIAEDYYFSQTGISGENSVLREWIGRSADNDRGRRVKVATVLHGNQTLQPTSSIHTLINSGNSTGYYRPIDAHEAYGAPVSLHISPLLASALQWASVDPAANRPWLDGPAFNARIGRLAQEGVIDLLGTTFSDHMLPYFSSGYTADSAALAHETLQRIYRVAPSTRVFWAPERVLDAASLQAITAAGYTHAFADQMRHLLKWFGRTSAFGNDGYRLNRAHGVTLIPINDQAGTFRFTTNDGGLGMRLRELLSRKARDGQQDQVVTLLSWWEDFASSTNANAYDTNLRWLASRPWIELTTPDRIAAGEVDLSRPADGQGDAWGVVERGAPALAKTAHDWLDFATQENYDNWYFGQGGREQGLASTALEIRPGSALPVPFGLQAGNGLMNQAWGSVQGIASGAHLGGLRYLARGTVHAGTFLTGWHNQPQSDLRKYSTGAYIAPDQSTQVLAPFARAAAAQVRFAGLHQRAAQWSEAVSAGSYRFTAVAEGADVDLDGEPESLLFNDRILAIFERSGGRLVAAFTRDVETSEVFQVIGNPLAYAGTEHENEGTTLDDGAGRPGSFRTSGFKDWFARTGSSTGTSTYVNDLRNVSPAPAGTGWTFTSADGRVSRTVTLSPRSSHLAASHTVDPAVQELFVRFGLSPNLTDLLTRGQAGLSNSGTTAGLVSLVNTTPAPVGAPRVVRNWIRYSGQGAGASLVASATDRITGWHGVPMRNQAQTQQVELSGTGNFSVLLGFETGTALSLDTDADGLPDWWEQRHGSDPADGTGANGPQQDTDGDGIVALDEFVLGTSPVLFTPAPTATLTQEAGSVRISTRTIPDRTYRVEFRNDLLSGNWTAFGPVLEGTGGEVSWIDDGTQTGGPIANGRRFYRTVVSAPVSPGAP